MIGVASWDTSSLSPGLYCSKSDFSKHKKGLSHEIVRIFRQTTCTQSCDQLGHELSLSRAQLKQICLSSLQKGLSHEISRIFW